MGYNDKYPDLSAMYAVQFEYENKLKDKIKELENELERTRKALEIAVDALKSATEYLGCQEPLVDVMAMNLHTDLSKALEQITALEQKD